MKEKVKDVKRCIKEAFGMLALDKDKMLKSDEKKNLILLQKQIEHCISNYDNKMVVVAVAGMLKAGKSTFVDVITRSTAASPVGYGRDTTIRPVLISMLSESESRRLGDSSGEIIIYRQTDEAISREEAYIHLFDYIRKGQSSRQCFNRHQEKLSPSLIQKFACQQSSEQNEPLLIEVLLRYNPNAEFFKIKDMPVKILDMPGLDSGTAEVAKNKGDFHTLLNECDFLYFVQKTDQVLNEQATTMLRESKKARPLSLFRLIRNHVESKPWLKEAVLEKELDEERKAAFESFREALEMKVDGRMANTIVNLGKAYGALINEDDELLVHGTINLSDYKTELLNGSKYDSLEKELVASIEQYSRDKFCKSALIYYINKTKETINYILEIKRCENERLKKERKGIDDALHGLESMNFVKDSDFDEKIFEIPDREVADIENWFNLCWNKIFKNINSNLDRDYKGSYIDKCMKRCALAIRDEYVRRIGKITLRNVYSGKRSAYEIVKDFIEKKLAELKIEDVSTYTELLREKADFALVKNSCHLLLPKWNSYYEPKPKNGPFDFWHGEYTHSAKNLKLKDNYDQMCEYARKQANEFIKENMPFLLRKLSRSLLEDALKTRIKEKEEDISKKKDDILKKSEFLDKLNKVNSRFNTIIDELK